MKYGILIGFCLTLFNATAFGSVSAKDLQYYRQLTNNIRTSASFSVPMPSSGNMSFDYKFDLGDFIYPEPIVSDFPIGFDGKGHFLRSFWDRVWLKDGSYVTINGEQIPLTCIFISAKDNRYSGDDSPLLPQFLLHVYIVANDYSCQGPTRPNWPESGGRRDNWDTYISYEIRDPTIMLPVDPNLRLRWNDFTAIFVK